MHIQMIESGIFRNREIKPEIPFFLSVLHA